ncbi:MAG: type II secretion system F family protein [Acidimicrobiales bacterium]
MRAPTPQVLRAHVRAGSLVDTLRPGAARASTPRTVLHRLGIETEPREVIVTAGAALAAAGVVGAGIAGVPGALGGVLLLMVAAVITAWTLRDRGERLSAAAIPDLVEAMARSLRSGASPPTALVEARAAVSAPLRRDLDPVVTELRAGVSFAEALARWRDRRPGAEVRLAVAALTLGSSGGGDRARGLDGVAATLRERQAIDGEIGASSAQAKASAAVVALLPLAFAVLGSVGGSGVADTLLGTAVGRVCLVAGLALDAAGAVWMHRIVRDAR